MRAISRMITNDSFTYLQQAFILNKGSILGLFFLFFCGSFIRAQSVAVDFPNTGCPSDSILIKLKPEFEYGKFIINDGVSAFWASEYKAAYIDEEKVTVRGFYADDSEIQSTYFLTSDILTCPLFTDLAGQICIESMVTLKLNNNFTSANVTIVGIEEDDNIIFDASSQYVFEMPRNAVIIEYSAVNTDNEEINHSIVIEPKFVIHDRDSYCAYEIVEIKECTCSEDVVWTVEWFESITATGSVFYFENQWTGEGGTNIEVKYLDGYIHEFTIYQTGDGYGENYLEGEIQQLETSVNCSSVDIIVNSGYDNYVWDLINSNDWYTFETNTETLSLSINFFNQELDLNVEGRIFETCDQLYIFDAQIDNVELSQAEIILDDNLDEIQGCNDSLFVILDDQYQNILWQIMNPSNGEIEASGNSNLIATYLNHPELNLEIYASDPDGNCVSQTKVLNLNLTELNPIEPCLITSSTDTPNNLIRWNNSNNSSIELYLLYREAINLGNYVLLDSFPNTMNNYLDITSQSGVQSYKYKLQVKDICGNYSPLEETDYHKTLHLTSNQGINGEVNLIWEEYEGLFFDNVIIYRQTDQNSPEILAQIPAGLLSYTDLNPPLGMLSYFIQLGGDFACNSIAYAISSNVIQQSIASSTHSVHTDYFNIHPNPTSDKLYVEHSETGVRYSIIDIHGRKILNGSISEFVDLNSLEQGSYFIILENQKGKVTKRFIKL